MNPSMPVCALFAALLGGCMPATGDGPAPSGAAIPRPADCPVLASRNWAASIDKTAAPEGPRLTVTGEVDLPTPGFGISWQEGPADRAMPPSQRLRLVLARPDGMVTQVVTPTPVRYTGKAAYPAYRAILVTCGDRRLATIDRITVVE